jgi:cell division transport system permease protein
MRRYRVSYFIGQALQGIWRNGVMSFASIAVLMSCLVVLGAFTLLVVNINTNLENLDEANKIIVFLDYNLTEEQIVDIERQIKKIKEAETVKRITADEALRSLAKRAGENALLYDDYFKDNPLSDSFEITYDDVKDLTTIEFELQSIEGVRKYRDQRYIVNLISDIKSGVLFVFLWFLVMLFIVSVFIIINTIKLSVYSRKNEISIMRYVGATGWFISLPFILEGAIIGLFASIIAYFVEEYLYKSFVGSLGISIEIITLIPFSELAGGILAVFIIIGVTTGIMGSSISLSKYTKK